MPSRLRKEQALLAALLALFMCRALMASAIVPPWQGPDEPEHFILAALLTTGNEALSSSRPVLERQILESMARYRWWDPYEVPTPDPLPTLFRQIPRFTTGTYTQPVYYGLGAATLRTTRPADLEAAYWHLRALSVALAVIGLVCGWCGTRLLFGGTVAAGATAIAALHPQFLLAAMTVNPDALAIALGAFIWWQVARAVTGRRAGLSLLLVLVAAAALLVTKRSAVPVGAVALVTVATLMWISPGFRMTRRTVVMILAALGAGGVLLLLGWLSFAGPLADLPVYWRNTLRIRRPFGLTMIPEAVAYLKESIDYGWLRAGWMRFPAPDAWLWVARALTAAGLAGGTVLFVRSPALRRPMSIAALFVVVQAATVIGWGFLALASPQGRYVFPVLAPATALLWMGLMTLAPPRFSPYAAPVLVATLALLDVTGLILVLVPAHLPWA
jgi:hypothetical protein